MEIDVTYTPQELARLDLQGRTVVVLDVLRATTTIIQGIANGCAAFVPVATVPAARRATQEVPPAARLLGGERGGLRIPGFDLGNSPQEYTAERVAGKTIVFTTTNGTAAITAAREAQRVLIGAFVNLEAVARHLVGQQGRVVLAASGKARRPALDDVVCAGFLVERLLAFSGDPCALTDGARIALEVGKGYEGRLQEALAESTSGKALVSIGQGQDLEFCARLSVLDVAPRVVHGRVVR